MRHLDDRKWCQSPPTSPGFRSPDSELKKKAPRSAPREPPLRVHHNTDIRVSPCLRNLYSIPINTVRKNSFPVSGAEDAPHSFRCYGLTLFMRTLAFLCTMMPHFLLHGHVLFESFFFFFSRRFWQLFPCVAPYGKRPINFPLY